MVLALLSSLGLLGDPDPGSPWPLVASSEQVRVYAALGTVRTDADMARMWVLVDFTRHGLPGGPPYRSVRKLDEYDCRQPRHRELAVFHYLEPMGAGEGSPVRRHAHGEWVPVPAGSALAGFRRIACAAGRT